VVLFALDPSQQTEISTDSGTVYDKNVVEYVGDAGYSFIDSTGKPKTVNVQSYQLDSSQILKLEKFLVQQACSTDMVLDKACAPVYKNVFMFYDADKKAIAQLHVCFQCEKTTFKPYQEYMCDFDNKVDFKALKNFVDNIKSHSKAMPITSAL
jgi:rubrerythrin